MSVSRRQFLGHCLSAGALALTGCAASTEVHRQRWYLFGTLVDVTVVHPDAPRVADVLGRLSTRFGDLHRNLHAWKPGVLMDVNRALAREQGIAIDTGLQALIADLKDCHRASLGAFNPAQGKLIGLWGFHGDALPTGAPPSVRQIEQLLADNPSPLDLHVAGGVLTSRNAQVQLDLGGYGKGYALDLGMQLLRDAGMGNAVINAGGDLNVAGRNGRAAWRIGIRDPRGAGALAWLETSGDEAIYTSGNYQRYLEYEGKRYAHILDPRNGMPVQDIVSATVIHRNGARADAAATALTVAGRRRWRAVAETLGVAQVMVINDAGHIEMTPAMAERVSLSAAARTRRIVV